MLLASHEKYFFIYVYISIHPSFFLNTKCKLCFLNIINHYKGSCKLMWTKNGMIGFIKNTFL